MVRRIILGADFERAPLSEPCFGGLREVDPASLPLGAGTKQALREWAAWYERGLASPDQQERFDTTGRRLWQVVRAELGPAFEVEYFSVVRRCRLAPDTES